MSYAQPLLAEHYCYGAKLFGFSSTNIAINLCLVMLKISNISGFILVFNTIK